MQTYKYLIVGGGMTADAAVKGIREVDAKGTIGIISSDSDPPYDRPPLTKALWKGKPLDSIWRNTAERGVDLHLNRTVNALDVQHKTVADDQKQVYSYDKLLLATGVSPQRLQSGAGNVIYFRNLADFRHLREMTTRGKRFAVIGGGFIGSELAAALAMNGKEVVLLFPGPGICHRIFPKDLSDFINGYYRQKGVEVWPGESVSSVEQRGSRSLIKTQNGREAEFDGVVAGLGVRPNMDLARMAGLQTADGIVVDEFLRTTHSDIYAAGDVALFYSPALQKRIRVEHEDNANTMGRLAGRNMAGKSEPYHHLPSFYSDLFDLGYEAVGELDSRSTILEDWKEPFREGVVYYGKDGYVRGVLLWNVWEQVEAARDLINTKRPFKPEDLKQQLPKAA